MKHLIFRSCLVIAILIGMSTQQTVVAAEKENLTFAVIRTEEMSVLADKWEKVLEIVGERAGVNLDFYATTSYASVVEAMLSGFVHIATLGPKIYIIANEKSKGAIQPIASMALPADMYMDKPCACYLGALITKKGSKFTTIASVKDSVLALVDPGSTSGSALPRALFGDKIGGKTLEEYFGRIFYSGSHTASARAVQKGKADAAFISLSMAAIMIGDGKAKKDDFNYLWISPEIPVDTVAVNKKTMKPELLKRLTDAFLSLGEVPELEADMQSLGMVGFNPTSDTHYDPLRAILEVKKKMKKQ
jgi:phosphonate transport system substrate-binding protein